MGNREMSDYDGVNGHKKFFSRGFQFDQVSAEDEGMIEHIYLKKVNKQTIPFLLLKVFYLV